MSTRDRKWKFTVWRAVLDFATVFAGIALAFYMRKEQPGVAIMIAGFVDLAANAATFFTTNVVQKNVISKHYRAELDDRLVESAENQSTGGSA